MSPRALEYEISSATRALAMCQVLITLGFMFDQCHLNAVAESV